MKSTKIKTENAAPITAQQSAVIRKAASAPLEQNRVNVSRIVQAPKVNLDAKTPKPKSAKKHAPLPYPADASKQDRMIVLLKQQAGATIEELITATGWQAHSVRGFLSATVRKKLRLPLVAEMRSTGERVYRIAGDCK